MSKVYQYMDEFFVIDSDTLNLVETKLYGYAVSDDGIMIGKTVPLGRTPWKMMGGAFVAVEVVREQKTGKKRDSYLSRL